MVEDDHRGGIALRRRIPLFACAFAFALNGTMTGVKAAQLDIIGMLTLGMVTALGGGILRDHSGRDPCGGAP